VFLVAVCDLHLRNFILRNEMQTGTASENLALSCPIPVYVSVLEHSTCPSYPILFERQTGLLPFQASNCF